MVTFCGSLFPTKTSRRGSTWPDTNLPDLTYLNSNVIREFFPFPMLLSLKSSNLGIVTPCPDSSTQSSNALQLPPLCVCPSLAFVIIVMISHLARLYMITSVHNFNQTDTMACGMFHSTETTVVLFSFFFVCRPFKAIGSVITEVVG